MSEQLTKEQFDASKIIDQPIIKVKKHPNNSPYYQTEKAKESRRQAMAKYYEKNKDLINKKRTDRFKEKYDTDDGYNLSQRTNSRIRTAITRAVYKKIAELKKNNEEYKEEDIRVEMTAIQNEKEKLHDINKPFTKRVRLSSKKSSIVFEKIIGKVLVDFN